MAYNNLRLMDLYDYDIHCTKLFEESVCSHRRGDVPIIKQRNALDCFIVDIPAKADRLFIKNFLLRENERILLARDTSAWNTRTEGLVITDMRIVYIPRKQGANNNLYIVRYDSCLHINSNSHSVLFWSDDENYLAVPKNFFFKARWKTYDFDRSIDQLTRILELMGQAHPQSKAAPFSYTETEKATMPAYFMDNYAEA